MSEEQTKALETAQREVDRLETRLENVRAKLAAADEEIAESKSTLRETRRVLDLLSEKPGSRLRAASIVAGSFACLWLGSVAMRSLLKGQWWVVLGIFGAVVGATLFDYYRSGQSVFRQAGKAEALASRLHKMEAKASRIPLRVEEASSEAESRVGASIPGSNEETDGARKR